MIDFSKLQNPINGTAQGYVSQGDIVSVVTSTGTIRAEALTDITSGEVIVFKDNSGKYYALGERAQTIQEETTQFFKSRINFESGIKTKYAILITVYRIREDPLEGSFGNDSYLTIEGATSYDLCRNYPKSNINSKSPYANDFFQTPDNSIEVTNSGLTATGRQQVYFGCAPNIFGISTRDGSRTTGRINERAYGNKYFYLYNSEIEKTVEVFKLPASEPSSEYLTTIKDEIRLTILHGTFHDPLVLDRNPGSQEYAEEPTSKDGIESRFGIRTKAFNSIKRFIWKWKGEDNPIAISKNFPDAIPIEDDPNQEKDWQKFKIRSEYNEIFKYFEGTPSFSVIDNKEIFLGDNYDNYYAERNPKYRFLEAIQKVNSRSLSFSLEQNGLKPFAFVNVINYNPSLDLENQQQLKGIAIYPKGKKEAFDKILTKNKSYEVNLSLVTATLTEEKQELTRVKTFPFKFKPIKDLNLNLPESLDTFVTYELVYANGLRLDLIEVVSPFDIGTEVGDTFFRFSPPKKDYIQNGNRNGIQFPPEEFHRIDISIYAEGF
ncbi:MAG: hypothetical protein QNJ54_16170 [Prochloraceae cyanobacterium]|nr:hypothetical protein [Prochloraceae cyanobacterium]